MNFVLHKGMHVKVANRIIGVFEQGFQLLACFFLVLPVADYINRIGHFAGFVVNGLAIDRVHHGPEQCVSGQHKQSGESGLH